MLFMCGLPGHGHLELIDLELEEDFVAVKNPQNLSLPRKFSYLEAAALALGLESIISYVKEPALHNRALHVKERLQEFLSQRESFVAVSEGSNEPEQWKNFEDLVSTACAQGTALQITYRSARTDSLSERVIFPKTLYRERGHAYTIAYCEEAMELRHFRIDRIMNAKPSSSQPSHSLTSQSGEKTQIIAWIAPRNRFFVEENPGIIQSISEADPLSDSPVGPGGLLVHFLIDDCSWLKRSLLELPDPVQIVEPAWFIEEFDAHIDAILDLYR